MLNTPMSPWPSYTKEEAAAVKRVLLSNRVNYWTGTECRDFEQEFAVATGSAHAVALANGSLALELALKALDIGDGDEVIVTPRSFIASASSVVNLGATPIFADIDSDSQNLTAATIAPHVGPKTRAIIVVHLAGWPCEMDEIMELARERNLYVIEDCAQAHGARYRGKSVGAIGDIGCWSFCQDKIISTGGEGGMVTTDDESLWHKMWSYKDHGKTWHNVYRNHHPSGFRWLHESFGSNWRLTEMQAAIGRIQLKRLDNWSEKRRSNSGNIEKVCLEFESLRVPMVPDYSLHARYKYYCFVNNEQLKARWSRDRIVEEMMAQGVPCYQGICPEIYLEKAFQHHPSRPIQRLPVARALGETSLMFLVHPTLTEEEIGRCCEMISNVMIDASR